jgi:hypothetical protein
VQLGGQVATEAMIEEGWFEYDGVIPEGNNFKLIDGVLVAYVPEKTEYQKYVDYKLYLDNTDHKMFIDYTPKPGEDLDAIKAERAVARDFCRDYESKYHQGLPI